MPNRREPGSRYKAIIRSIFWSVILLASFFQLLPASAQGVRATYALTKNLPGGLRKVYMDMQMDHIDGKAAFYSERSFLRDSLNLLAFDRNGSIQDEDAYGKIIRIPSSIQDFTAVDYISSKYKQLYYEVMILFTGTGDLQMPNWEILEEYRDIDGYPCQKAQAQYLGREWHIWFTPSIPCQAGPWLLWGAPGLIVYAQDSGNCFQFRLRYVETLPDNHRAILMENFLTAKHARKKAFNLDMEQCEKLHTKFRTDPDFFGQITNSKAVSVKDAKGNSLNVNTSSSYIPLIPNEYWKTQ